jgi:hypothetical protein
MEATHGTATRDDGDAAMILFELWVLIVAVFGLVAMFGGEDGKDIWPLMVAVLILTTIAYSLPPP